MSRIPINPIAAPDYDQIAGAYDSRYRRGEQPGIRALLTDRMRSVAPGRWLEVGCGTGQWLSQFVADLSFIGLDQSQSMLAKASEKLEGVPLVHGSALALPFAANSVHGLSVIHAIHHFPDQDKFLREAYRVLVHGGGLLIVGMDAFDPNLEWYMYDFFAGVAARDRARFPDFDMLSERLKAMGFGQVTRGTAHRVDQISIGEQVLAQPFLSRRGCSQMALLSDEEYQSGMDRILKTVKQDPSFEFKAQVSLDFLWAQKR